MNKHGHIAFSWQNNLLTLDVKGPFNEEGFAHSIALIKQSVLNRNRIYQQWKRLSIWDDEVLASPEVVAKCKNADDWYVKMGCAYSAIVVSNNIQVHLLKK